MKRSTNNLEVKRLNRNRVFRYINSMEEASMPEISAALNISGPTVLTIVNELKSEGVVQEAGELKSTGGRKAKAIATVKDARYAVGVDITKEHVSITYTDVAERALKHERIRKSFRYSDEYMLELARLVENFIKRCEIPEDRIEGIGISVPGIIDKKSDRISRSHALGIRNVPCEDWARYFSYPCRFVNDANAAALAESIGGDNSKNMAYLMLSNTVGGAIIYRNTEEDEVTGWIHPSELIRLHAGDHSRSAEFGHMVIHPGGRECYCGKKGCLDAYCSALRLADLTEGNLEAFFRKMESGDEKFRAVWDEYISNLIVAVDNIRMCFDCEVVLGGYVGNQIEPYIPEIRRQLADRDIFSHDGNYVRACNYRSEASGLGAAISWIEYFINEI